MATEAVKETPLVKATFIAREQDLGDYLNSLVKDRGVSLRDVLVVYTPRDNGFGALHPKWTVYWTPLLSP